MSLQTFAKMLGLPTRLAEDALHSESSARAVLTRRSLFAAGAALAAGSVLVGGPLPLYLFTDGTDTFAACNLPEALAMRREYYVDTIGYNDDELLDLESGADLVQMSERRSFTIYDDDDGVTRGPFLASEWARSEGPGFLCTTEY